MTATTHVKTFLSVAAVTDFKTRVLRLKPEVQILGSSKSICHTKEDILHLKSCFLRKKETKLNANLWKTFCPEFFCWRSWWFHVVLFEDLYFARGQPCRSWIKNVWYLSSLLSKITYSEVKVTLNNSSRFKWIHHVTAETVVYQFQWPLSGKYSATVETLWFIRQLAQQ